MKQWMSTTLQVVAGLGQVVNVAEPLLPMEARVGLGVGLALTQLLVNAMAHRSNPDGTPAEVAWVPRGRK